jgi:hypothetical protein
MSNILDQMAGPIVSFRPKTLADYFALQLSRHLNDTANLRDYLVLVEREVQTVILQAYRRAIEGGNSSLAARFQSELLRIIGSSRP